MTITHKTEVPLAALVGSKVHFIHVFRGTADPNWPDDTPRNAQGSLLLVVGQEPFDGDPGQRTAYIYEFECYGDCCSETWFADIVGVRQLLDATITAAIKIEMPPLPNEADERSRQEYDSVYGIRLVTTRGSCDLIYRNSSNGYYGGSADLYRHTLPDLEDPENADTKARLMNEDVWEPITADWRA